MRYLELSVETEAAAVETVSAIMHEHGEGGVAVYQHVVPDDEDAAYHYDTSRPTTVTTYVPATPDGERRRAAIAAALGHLTVFNLARIGPVKAREVDEEDWANAWKEFYHPTRFGRRLVVKPSWHDYAARPDDLVIELDPGMAFGTGLHQTTALCLALLEDYVSPGAVVLDQGTGSGILSIAAGLLGARRVVAIDNSEVAVAAARENAARNGLGDVIDAFLGQEVPPATESIAKPAQSTPKPATNLPTAWGPRWQNTDTEVSRGVSDVPAQYDVVVANIIANVIIALAPDFAHVLKPGGPLIASGIIREREDDVRTALADAGFTVERRETQDEWVALVARRLSTTLRL